MKHEGNDGAANELDPAQKKWILTQRGDLTRKFKELIVLNPLSLS